METAVLKENGFYLKEENLEQIGSYVREHLGDWLKQDNVIPMDVYRFSIESRTLSERIVRVEECLKSQGQLLEKMLVQFDKRFEQVDKHFEQVNKRFEQMNKNFSHLFFYIITMGVFLSGVMTFYKFFSV